MLNDNLINKTNETIETNETNEIKETNEVNKANQTNQTIENSNNHNIQNNIQRNSISQIVASDRSNSQLIDPVILWGLPDPTISISHQEAKVALISSFIIDSVISELSTTQRFLSLHVERLAHTFIKASAAKILLSQVEIENQTGITSNLVSRILRVMLKKGLIYKKYTIENDHSSEYLYALSPILMNVHLLFYHSALSERYASMYASQIIIQFMSKSILSYKELKELLLQPYLEDEYLKANAHLESQKIEKCFTLMMKDHIVEEALESEISESTEGNFYPNDFTLSQDTTEMIQTNIHENNSDKSLEQNTRNQGDIFNNRNEDVEMEDTFVQDRNYIKVKYEPMSDEEENLEENDNRSHSDYESNHESESLVSNDMDIDVSEIRRDHLMNLNNNYFLNDINSRFKESRTLNQTQNETPHFESLYFSLNYVNIFRYWQIEQLLNYIRKQFGLHCASIVNSIISLSTVYKDNFHLSTDFIPRIQAFRYFKRQYSNNITFEEYESILSTLIKSKILIEPYGDSSDIAVHISYIKNKLVEEQILEHLLKTYGNKFIFIYNLLKEYVTLEQRRIIYLTKLKENEVKEVLNILESLELVKKEIVPSYQIPSGPFHDYHESQLNFLPNHTPNTNLPIIEYELTLWTLIKEYSIENLLSSMYYTAFRLRKRQLALNIEINELEKNNSNNEELNHWIKERESLLETIRNLNNKILIIDEWI